MRLHGSVRVCVFKGKGKGKNEITDRRRRKGNKQLTLNLPRSFIDDIGNERTHYVKCMNNLNNTYWCGQERN